LEEKSHRFLPERSPTVRRGRFAVKERKRAQGERGDWRKRGGEYNWKGGDRGGHKSGGRGLFPLRRGLKVWGG